jgi:hypothetical protein
MKNTTTLFIALLLSLNIFGQSATNKNKHREKTKSILVKIAKEHRNKSSLRDAAIAKERIDSEVYKYYDTDSNTWAYGKAFYYFDNSGNVTKVRGFDCDASYNLLSNDPSFIDEYSYYTNGNLLYEKNIGYDNKNITYQYEYRYDNFNNQISDKEYDLNKNGQLYQSSFDTSYYNTDNKLVFEKNYWADSLGISRLSYSTDLQYDTNKNLISKCNYNYNNDTLSSSYCYTYTYDSQNLRIEEHNNNSYFGNFSNKFLSKTTYQYNINKQLVTQLYYNNSIYDSAYTVIGLDTVNETSITNFVYDNAGRLILENNYSYYSSLDTINGGNDLLLLLNAKTQHIYTSNQVTNVDESYYYSVDSMGIRDTISRSMSGSKNDTLYDSNGNKIRESNYYYVDSLQTYIENTKYTYSYDANNNLTEEIYYSTDTVNKLVPQPSYKDVYKYDLNSDINTVLGGKYLDSWVNEDSNNKPLSYTEYTYENQTWKLDFTDSLIYKQVYTCNAEYVVDYNAAQNTFVLTISDVAAAQSFSWNFGDGGTSSLMTPTHDFAKDTLYNVCLKIVSKVNNDTCSYCHVIGKDSLGNVQRQSGFKLTVVAKEDIAASINNNSVPYTTASVYPNPASDIITIHVSEENAVLNVTILDIQGNKIIEQTITNNGQLSVHNLTNGMYIYKITNKDSSILKTGKLLIAK